jgi:large subunit ribosomal protein L22
METRAIQRYVRITPRKCNQVLELIRGQSVEEAQITLEFTPKLGARIVQKVLKSAVANALHAGKVRLEDLYVKEAVVGAGPTLKRWLPRAQGRATPLLKRTSHVKVTVASKE